MRFEVTPSMYAMASNAKLQNRSAISGDVSYDAALWDGTPGRPWDDFKMRIRNIGAQSDDRGFSFADHWDGSEVRRRRRNGPRFARGAT